MSFRSLITLIFIFTLLFHASFPKVADSEEKEENSASSSSRESASGEAETDEDEKQKEYYKFLIRRLKQNANAQRSAAKKTKDVPAAPYAIPGPFEPLPGRSHNGDYWPLFPFVNQYSGGLDLDPALSRHIGGDFNIPIPSWGMMDIRGHFFKRISDTTTKLGYVSQPVNMLGLDKKDFARLVSDPRLNYNRYLQPNVPVGKVPKSYVATSCKAPLCNPYTGTFSFGVEHDIGGSDGFNGDIDVPIPISKGVAYRYPIGGNIYYDLDNITIGYGHNVGPLDPYTNPYMFGNPDYIKNTDKILEYFYAIANPATQPRKYPPRQTRTKREIYGFDSMPDIFQESYSTKVSWNDFKHPLLQRPRAQKQDHLFLFTDKPKYQTLLEIIIPRRVMQRIHVPKQMLRVDLMPIFYEVPIMEQNIWFKDLEDYNQDWWDSDYEIFGIPSRVWPYDLAYGPTRRIMSSRATVSYMPIDYLY